MPIKGFSRRDSSEMHDKIVKSVVRHLERDGYVIKTKNIGHPHCGLKPEKGIIPDIYAVKGFQKIIVKIETGSNLSSQNLKKWKRFNSDENCQFWVVVPPACIKNVLIKKQSFNLPLEVYCSNYSGKLEKK